jgi:hypothetical protein
VRVHATLGVHYEAMAAPPDPVDEDREEVLTLGRQSWRPGSRRGAIIAALVMAAAVLARLLVTRDDNHPTANRPAPPSSVGVQPAAPVTGTTNASRLRTTLHGSPLSGTSGAQVLISQRLGSPVAWFSLDTGALLPLDLPPNAEGYLVQPFPGGVLFRPEAAQSCDSCPGPLAPVYYAASGSRAATMLGFANWDAAVTADYAAVWLTSFRLATEPYSSRSQTLTTQKVDLSGYPLEPPVTLPPGYLPAGGGLGQPAGKLLLQPWTNPKPTAGHYRLWDPSSRTATATFGSVIAVGTHQIAWTASSCTERNCPLHLTDPTTGMTITQPVPPGQMPTLGSYSPDGHHLALLVSASADNASGAVEIGLLDEATYRLTLIPGTTLDIIPTLTWSADGRWLLITSLGDAQLGLVNPRTGLLQVSTLPD